MLDLAAPHKAIIVSTFLNSGFESQVDFFLFLQLKLSRGNRFESIQTEKRMSNDNSSRFRRLKNVDKIVHNWIICWHKRIILEEV